MTNLMILGFILVAVVVIALGLPNRIFDTKSCKRNWSAICVLLVGACLIIEQLDKAIFFACLLSAGILTNYLFPILLNVLITFNRKSDP